MIRAAHDLTGASAGANAKNTTAVTTCTLSWALKLEIGNVTRNAGENMSSNWEDTAALVMRIRGRTFGTPWVIGFWTLSIAAAVVAAVYVTAAVLH